MQAFTHFRFKTKQQLIILLVLVMGLNVNTLFNQYALDDVVVMTGNTLVAKGFKGIPEILSKDFFYGLEKKGSDLSGGRYRPLSLIVFAVEYQFFGENPFVSHLINLGLMLVLIAMLFHLLEAHLFHKYHAYMAFLTCLVFLVHPVHAEVIANVKSRDELLAAILLIASALLLIKSALTRSMWAQIGALLCFFLALLTRESAVPFIGLVPLVAYYFYNKSVSASIRLAIPLILVFVAYMIIRVSVVGFGHSSNTEILNAPYLFATASEAFATKMYILLKYILLLICPFPLSCDYGFNQIPYIQLGSLTFLVSLFSCLFLLVYAGFAFTRRTIISFCIFFFFGSLFLFSNFVMDIGAPLAERLLFQPSLAFCILVSFFYLKVSARWKLLPAAFLVILLITFSLKTISRNEDWKNNETLYLKDVVSAPNSVRTNMYAAHLYITKAQAESNKALRDDYYNKAIVFDKRILGLDPHYAPIYGDLGTAYYGLLNYGKASEYWRQAYKLEPLNPLAKQKLDLLSDVLFNEGNKKYKSGDTGAAIEMYRKAVELNEKNVDAWYNLGKLYFVQKETKNGLEAWQVVLRLSPNYSFTGGAN